jgi:MYXO-CTERM domain-containing protein
VPVCPNQRIDDQARIVYRSTMTPWTLLSLATSADAAGPGSGPPDAVVTSNCDIDSAGFVDVDSDGTDDLTIQVEDTVFTWPSSRRDPEPTRLTVPGSGEDDRVELASGDGSHPALVSWTRMSAAESDEYTIDPVTLELTLRWTEPAGSWVSYFGDIDGDGLPDQTDGWSWLRLSGSGLRVPLLPEAFVQGGETFRPAWPHPVGDLNGDGYDDLVVAMRAYESVENSSKWCSNRAFGPARLYLGSPDGLQPEPLWTLWAEGRPDAGVGREVVAIPGEDTLVVTMVREGDWGCADHLPGFLAVIRDAGTPGAWFDHPITEVAHVDPEGSMAELVGLLEAPDGPGLVLHELTSDETLHRFPWDSTSGIVDAQTGWSAFLFATGYLPSLAEPVGRQHQAVWLPNWAGDNFDLLVWGRSVDEVGPAGALPAEGWCHFEAKAWTELYPDPGDTEPTEPADETDDPNPSGPDPGRERGRSDALELWGCSEGCATGGGPRGLLPLALLAGAAVARRSRHS